MARRIQMGSQQQKTDSLFQLLVAFVVAVSLTLAMYTALSLAFDVPVLDGCLGKADSTGLPWAVALLLSRTWLQPLNCWLFAMGATVLAMRLYEMRAEQDAFSHDYFQGIPLNQKGEPVLTEQTRSVMYDTVQDLMRQYSGSMPLLLRRMEAGSRRLAEDGDAGEVHAILKHVAELDRDAVEGRMTLIRYVVWLIPTVGFLGTVIGIGWAISGFEGVFAQGSGEARDLGASIQPLLRQIASELGVAFDTTSLALCLSAMLVALAFVVQSREEALLAQIDDYCIRHFVSRIAVPNAGVKQLATTLEHAFMSLAAAVQGNASNADDYTLRDLAGQLASQFEQLQQALTTQGAARTGGSND